MRPLQDKVVVITGASSGLGRAAALEFARAGARIVVASRRINALEQTANLCRDIGGSVSAVVTDVTDEDSVRHLASSTLERQVMGTRAPRLSLPRLLFWLLFGPKARRGEPELAR